MASRRCDCWLSLYLARDSGFLSVCCLPFDFLRLLRIHQLERAGRASLDRLAELPVYVYKRSGVLALVARDGVFWDIERAIYARIGIVASGFAQSRLSRRQDFPYDYVFAGRTAWNRGVDA